jgi:hypothetical protein
MSALVPQTVFKLTDLSSQRAHDRDRARRATYCTYLPRKPWEKIWPNFGCLV